MNGVNKLIVLWACAIISLGLLTHGCGKQPGGVAPNVRIETEKICDFTVTSPCSSSTWVCGENRTIMWSSTGDSATVRIELCHDTTSLASIADSTPNDGSYEWLVDDCGVGVSSGYRIKIAQTSDSTCYAYSDCFTIADACGFTVTSPHSGSTWLNGEARTISWNTSGGSNNVRLDLYKGAALLCTIASCTPNDGSFAWTVDDCGNGYSTEYRVKIADAADPTCYACSELFTIGRPCGFNITNPDSASNWLTGESRSILWEPSGGSGTVKIELYKGGAYLCPIAASTANDGTYQWVVQDCSGGFSSEYTVKISDAVDPGCHAYSDKFTIGASCSLSITSPASGTSWILGDNRAILWDHTGGSGNVKIELYESSSYLCTIAASTPNRGSYQWVVDNCGAGPSSHYSVKITDANDSRCYDYSDEFAIVEGTTHTRVYQQGIDGYAGCEDTYMILWLPDDNFADRIYIECMTDDGREPAGGMKPLIRFNDLGLAGCKVEACTLQVYCYLALGECQVIQVHEVLRDWEPGQVTPRTYASGCNWTEYGCGCNDLDARSSYVSSIVDCGGGDEWKSFPLPASLVQKWIDSPEDQNNGLLIWSPETGVIKDRSFRSANMFISSLRPKLIVHYRRN
jgi:hypothetical protein